MSQPMPEAPTRGAPPGTAAGGTGLSRKIGPLPVWAWVAAAAAVGVGYIWWRNHQSASAASTAASTDTSGSGTDDADSIATLQSEIQQLQGEESTDVGNPQVFPKDQGGGKVKVITVPRAETLSALGKSLKWNSATLKAVEALNGLSASSKLKKGQKIVRPVGKTGEPT